MAEIGISRLVKSQEKHASQPQARFFYGWWMVLAGTAILFVSSGIGFYGHGVILDPLRSAHGWSKATISSAITLYFFATGIIGLLIGRLIDKYGPKWILVIGSMLFGLGFIFLSMITKIWQLYAVYLFLSIGFCCTSLVSVNTLITNWFIRRRGFALSLTNTGLSLGGIVLVPLASWAVANWGLQMALPVLGVIFWMVITPTALFFIKQRPADVNQFPDGIEEVSVSAAKMSSTLNYAAQMQAWTRARAIKTVAFWAIVGSFMMALGGQIAFLVHQVSFLSQYLGRAGAATAVSITAAMNLLPTAWFTFIDTR